MSETSTRRKARTLPRFSRVPAEIAARWRRRNIDCATCPLFRESTQYGEPGGLYAFGYCGWTPAIPGAPQWANEHLRMMIGREGGSMSRNPRKGTCAAKPVNCTPQARTDDGNAQS